MRIVIPVLTKRLERLKAIDEQQKREARTIQHGQLRLYLDEQNRVRLYYDTYELTKHHGLSVGVLSEGAWHYSADATCEAEKISESQMRLTLRFPGMPMSQIWNIGITAEGAIMWDVSMELRESLRLDASNARVFLSKAYSRWTIPLQEGAFPAQFHSGYQPLDFAKETCDFIGCISLDAGYPSAVLKDASPTKAGLHILNTDANFSSRVLELQFENNQELYQPGTYPYLKAVIQLYPDKAVLETILKKIRDQKEQERKKQEAELAQKQEEERRRQEAELKKQQEAERKKQEAELKQKQEEERKRQEEELKRQEAELKKQQEAERQRQEAEQRRHLEDQERRTLQKGPLRLYVAADKRLHLYYKECELTKGVGFWAGIFSEGDWHGSDNAQCEIERPSSDEMLLRLVHSQLPITQTWRLIVQPEGTLSWDIELCVKETLRIDRKNAFLFLSKAYDEWIFPPQEGAFPISFGSEWRVVSSAYTDDTGFIGVRSRLEQIPSLILSDKDSSQPLLCIQNTDFKVSSRVLELQFENNQELYQPGTYPYLKAVIQLYPDKAVLETILKKIRDQKEQERKKQEAELAQKQEEERRRQEAELKKQQEAERKKQEAELKQKQEEERKRQEEELKRQEAELKKQQEAERQRQEAEQRRHLEDQERRTLQKGPLRLYVAADKRLHLYYKECELTKGVGFWAGIFSEGDWHGSDNAQCEIERPSSDEMLLRLVHSQLPITQTWRLIVQPEGTLSWDIELCVKETLRIDRKNAFLFLSKAYDEWIFPPQEGAFPISFGSEWRVVSSAYTDDTGFIGVRSRLEQIPSLILSDKDSSQPLLCIQNTDFKVSSRVLELQFENNQELYQPGTYPYLKAVIQLYPDKAVLETILKKIRDQKEQERKKQEAELAQKQEEERRRQEAELKKQQEAERKKQEAELKQKQEEERKRQEEELKRQEAEQERLRKVHVEDRQRRTLREGPFRVYFDQHNCTHLYYNDAELTKGFGFHTTILSEGDWYSLIDATLEIERSASDEMTVYLSHNTLPLTQIWHIKLKPEGTLIWEVNVHLREVFRIDRRNATLFLSKAYDEWIFPPQEGAFPVSFGSEWQVMHTVENNVAFIGSRSSHDGMPSISFRNDDSSQPLLCIQNTDFKVSSRVLELQFENNQELYQPGTYPYLKAVIQLYPDKAVLETILKKIRDQKEQERKKQEAELAQKQEEERRRQEAELKKQQEAERKKQEAELKQKQEEERKRQEEELKKQQEAERQRQEEEERKARERAVERVYAGLSENMVPIVPGAGMHMYIFGDSPELHDKIASSPGEFGKIISQIKASKKDRLEIKIGISRFNFFKLHTIAQFCSGLVNSRVDLRAISLSLFPVKNLSSHFVEYVKELNVRLNSTKISFFLKDEKLLDLLWTISSQADQYNERDLLRLLGVVAEHPFIGPQTMVLDTYHRCNTNCIHCWIHTPRRKLPAESNNLEMAWGLYKKIIDDAAAVLCDEIIIQGDGEPLLDKRFMDMICYARAKGLKTLFFTNGILLNKDKARQLIDLGIEEIFCSLPAGTPGTYAKINAKQSKDTFHRIVRNLTYLLSERNKSKKDKPRLQMTHVIHNLNYGELPQMSKIDASIKADKVRFYLARLDENTRFLKLEPRHIGAMKKSLEEVTVYLKKKNIILQDNIHFQLKHYNSATGYWSKDAFLKTGCPVGWFFCLVLAKGEVSMCCHLRVVDRLKEGTSFKEIWDSPGYNTFRIQAKYLVKHKDVVFPNGVKLHDAFCNHCDTHQVILGVEAQLRKYSLAQFL